MCHPVLTTALSASGRRYQSSELHELEISAAPDVDEGIRFSLLRIVQQESVLIERIRLGWP